MILAPEPHARDAYRLLTAAARLVQRLHDDALAPLGLTRAAVIALEAVAPRPMYQEQLAAKVHVQSQTLGRVLARLEEGGLVTRTRNPADRRQFQVQISEAGNAALQAASEAERAAVPADFDGWETLSEQLARFVDFFQTPRTGIPGSSAPSAPKPGPEASLN
ncbi:MULTISPECIES: MarR family winged helix-turn-helix transcriptional regulator [unclassified Arthrobacter]|uniref:MarR family winged helix-turn-helix transcriptional regulator n=1 Tax=unclassified Arthrobacter TaxID=235627 RepID=UPI001D84EBF7|nr:MarR family transcriptional regulator [Arthrobacter sp. Bi26]CAH0134871.1 Transcriptional regulator SlyA [Arthrobacter sp. Bi26]